MSKQKHQPKEATEQQLSKELDKELESTFPASDPPASTQPGGGITGPEVTPPHPKQK